MGGGASDEGGDAVLVTASGGAAADGDPADAAAAVGVTYCFDAETWLDRWGNDREHAVAVSAGEQSRSAAAVTSSESVSTGPSGPSGPGGDPVQVEAGVVEAVPSESDVGSVGAAVHEYLDEWGAYEPTVYVDSLAEIVEATDAEVTFRFLHALVARARDADARVVAAVGDDLPEHVVATFEPLFDEVR
jgi:hypothetical protein